MKLPRVGQSFDAYQDAAIIMCNKFKDAVALLCNGPLGYQYCPPLKKTDRGLVAVFYALFDPRVDVLTWSAVVNQGSLVSLEDFIERFEREIVTLCRM